MVRGSDARLLVLHALALRGHGAGASVAGLAGLTGADADQQLAALASDGLVAPASGALTGWVATPEGRREHRRLLAAELDAAGAREKVAAAYDRFRAINGEFLQACTDWQVRNGSPNDHTSAVHDLAVIGRLHDIHRRIQPVLDDLEACLDRFATFRYRDRFAHAIDRIDAGAGERDWFTKPMIDSYHTVWFQLHEDLLATLGIERSQEEM